MPTYQYACTECGERLEVVQKFSDDPLTVCPACAGKLRKLFSAVGVVFKGSGFYKTDSRSNGRTPTPAGAGKGGESSSAGGNGSASPSDGAAGGSSPSSSSPSSGNAGPGDTGSGSSRSTSGDGSKVA